MSWPAKFTSRGNPYQINLNPFAQPIDAFTKIRHRAPIVLLMSDSPGDPGQVVAEVCADLDGLIAVFGRPHQR